ncbi:hypothetical protein BSPWISOXPB_10833 [uncultured Gammaproteobacteria bacterium]|nr:hypothetical protein BSPWISOXPB_10833 [uncultured Gammaproteobacteria bacterium]
MRKNKPVLIVVAGPNGSGKTTITERLLTHSWTDNATYINPDILHKSNLAVGTIKKLF